MRAVEELAKSARVALMLVRGGGRIALMIGATQVGQAMAVLRDVSWDPAIAVPESRSRIILAGTKPAKVVHS